MKQRIGEKLLVTRSGSKVYIPDEGDIVWLNFDPQVGHEQKGHRPAIIISPMIYNAGKSKLALVCPITSTIRNSPYEVRLPEGMITSGVVLADHIKSSAWQERNAQFIEKVPHYFLADVSYRIKTLLPSFPLE